MRTLISLVKLARPAQWAKNVFVFAALIFSGLLLDPQAVVSTIVAFISFALASSAVYYFNDLRDMKEDQRHPTKCNRPLAKGDICVPVAISGALILLISAIWLGISFLGAMFTAVVTAYIILNVAYSSGLKHLVIIDVFIISAGFVLRVLAGSAAIGRMPSTWLVLCAVTISLFLGFTKRKAEITCLGETASKHRKVLGQYAHAFLDQAISIVTAATIIFYILYTVDKHTTNMVGSHLLVLSVPLVLYGIFRYLYLVYHLQSGGDPTRTIFTDVPMLLTGIAWAILCTVIVLYGEQILHLFRS